MSIFVGRHLAKAALLFRVAGYSWLYLIGLSCAVVVARGSTPQALSGLLTGLLFSTVVLGAVHAQARFTFGQAQLCQGVNFIPAMVGLFGVSEVLRRLLQGSTEAARCKPPQPLRSAGNCLRRCLWNPVAAAIGPAA